MGKFLHNFETSVEFNNEYIGSGYTEPWVSLTQENSAINYNKGSYDFIILDSMTGEVETELDCSALELTGKTYSALYINSYGNKKCIVRYSNDNDSGKWPVYSDGGNWMGYIVCDNGVIKFQAGIA